MRWLFEIPGSVPPELRRYFLYWKVFYAFGALVHLIALLMFALGGIGLMVWFNVASVPFYLVAQILLHRGHYRAPFWLISLELIAHGIVASICVGPQGGFQGYIYFYVILVFVQPFYTVQRAALLAGGGLVTLLALMVYIWHQPPIYAVDPLWLTLLMLGSYSIFPVGVVAMVLPFILEARRAEAALAAAYDESERLLLNILPAPIAARLKRSGEMIADDHERVAILFADIVDFTSLAERLPPERLVALLNDVFNAFDTVAERHGVEKVKTIGDAYMMVAGVPTPQADPDVVIGRVALDLQRAAAQFRLPDTGAPLQLRIGINAGRVVAGVIGRRKFAYDMWGDAVNVAARMESTGEPGRIQLPATMAARLADRFRLEPRGTVEVKGKGSMQTCFLIGERA